MKLVQHLKRLGWKSGAPFFEKNKIWNAFATSLVPKDSDHKMTRKQEFSL
jgi:hypothetical protein